MQQTKSVNLDSLHFTCQIDIEGETAPEFRIVTQLSENLPDTHLLRIMIGEKQGPQFSLKQLHLTWQVPATNMHGFIGPGAQPDEIVKLPYWNLQKQSGANRNIPFVALINRNHHNRYTFGLIDQITDATLNAELSEQTRSYHFDWQKPVPYDQPIVTNYWEEILFVSRADTHWAEVLRTYVATVDRLWEQTKLPVPASAFEPVFCTWTAIHHDVDEDWIIHNAKLAAGLGFKTWITDDGWFTDKASFADYRYAGDWEPCEAKFPSFKRHVREVQEMGMRYILWVAPFMVGDASIAAKKYEHLMSTPVSNLYFSNLSPWHEETTPYITNLLERLVTDYGLDGLKIDFVDSIHFDAERNPKESSQSLGKAVYSTLKTAINRLAELKPDVLIEFRNTYANLASRQLANIYRSSDVPINFILNRWQVTMLRLLTPDRAIHFDPALWHQDDSDENVAVHLINAIISVPMVSIELEVYPQSHYDLIRYWISFYNEHRDTIIHGNFQPHFIFGHVGLIRFVGKEEQIIGLYGDIPVTIQQDPIPLWILNASSRPYIDILSDNFNGKYYVSTKNKFGETVKKETVTFPCYRLDVEVGGSLKIARIS
jgi:alpha-galactosidase